MFEWLKELATNYEKLINAFGVVFNLLIGVGLLMVAHAANKISSNSSKSLKYKISSSERKIFHSNYTKLVEAISLTLQEGRVTKEAKILFWKARDQARLELPKEIQIYTGEIFEIMQKAYLLHQKLYNFDGTSRSLPRNEKSEIVSQHDHLINQIIEKRPSEVYAKYMKIAE